MTTRLENGIKYKLLRIACRNTDSCEHCKCNKTRYCVLPQEELNRGDINRAERNFCEMFGTETLVDGLRKFVLDGTIENAKKSELTKMRMPKSEEMSTPEMEDNALLAAAIKEDKGLLSATPIMRAIWKDRRRHPALSDKEFYKSLSQRTSISEQQLKNLALFRRFVDLDTLICFSSGTRTPMSELYVLMD